jgi:hypothetical protein
VNPPQVWSPPPPAHRPIRQTPAVRNDYHQANFPSATANKRTAAPCADSSPLPSSNNNSYKKGGSYSNQYVARSASAAVNDENRNQHQQQQAHCSNANRRNREYNRPWRPAAGGTSPHLHPTVLACNPNVNYNAVSKMSSSTGAGGRGGAGSSLTSQHLSASYSAFADFHYGVGVEGPDSDLIRMIERDCIDKSAKVSWSDIAGLEKAKQILEEAVVLPFLIPEFFRGDYF